MSKYFQVLERLERTQDPSVRTADFLVRRDGIADRLEPRTLPRGPRPVAKPAVEPSAEEVVPQAPPEPDPTIAVVDAIPAPPPWRVEDVEAPTAPTAREGIDALFQNIDALTMGRRPLALVFAGASTTPAVDTVTSGLTAYAEAKGERVLVADLREAGGRTVLVPRFVSADPSAPESSAASALEIDLRGGACQESLARWREEIGAGVGLTFLIGPPLIDSVSSALLASLCDGLVIVAVREETHRTSLTVAAERARLTKSPTLGVVVSHGPDRRPSWLRRIIGH